jgi:hypothetical protein
MKKLKVPNLFRIFHGQETNIAELLLIYGIAIAAPVIVYFTTRSVLPELPWWITLLLFVIVADLAGGIIANLTYGATAFYEKRQWRKAVFILLHAAHPAVIYLLTREQLPFLVYTAGITLLFSFITAFAFRQPRQQFFGFISVCIAVAFGFILFGTAPFYRVVSILYMLKLIYSFSVDHYGCRE